MRTVLLTLVTATLLLATPLAAQSAPTEAPHPLEQRYENLLLTVRLPAEWGMSESPESGDPQIRTRWTGKQGETSLLVDLVLFPQRDFSAGEPTELLNIIGQYRADPNQGGDRGFHFDELTHVQGRYGVASYAAVSSSLEPFKEGESRVLRLAGLLDGTGYVLELRARPDPGPAQVKLLREALIKAAESDAEPRDPKWSKREVEERWKASAPEDLVDELDDVLRTPHYLILTNSSGGKTFAKKMEECYAAIKKVFPFEEVAGRRLMPVFLFRTNDQYYAFLGRNAGWDVESAKRTQGVAYMDFYTTWYEAPGDPVHIHEATHQIFANRLFLGGGGSWFQEGVAEFMSSTENERGEAAHAVKKGKHVPLAKFVTLQSLIFSNPKDEKDSSDEAPANQYNQAALLVEFLSKSKFGKAKFLDYIHAVGAVPRNDVGAIQSALKRVYGVDIEGLEKAFVDYCKKR
jgi:hypothetical protein